MTLKSKFVFLLLLTLLVPFVLSDASTADGNRQEKVVGGWQPIKNLKAPGVQEVAQFAVTEHNKKADTNLKFQRVVRGQTKVVSGVNYRLVITAKDGIVSNKYEAIVWVKPWEHYRNLTSFKKL